MSSLFVFITFIFVWKRTNLRHCQICIKFLTYITMCYFCLAAEKGCPRRILNIPECRLINQPNQRIVTVLQFILHTSSYIKCHIHLHTDFHMSLRVFIEMYNIAVDSVHINMGKLHASIFRLISD